MQEQETWKWVKKKRTFVKTVERRLKECMKYLFFIIRILFACVGLMAGKAFAGKPFCGVFAC